MTRHHPVQRTFTVGDHVRLKRVGISTLEAELFQEAGTAKSTLKSG